MTTDLSVLVVEDQTNVRAMYEAGLSKSGYRVRVAPDSVIALEWLKTELFDAALIDLSLPGPDGLNLAQQIRTMQQDCAIIMISAAPTRDHVLNALRMHIDDFLIKPADIDDIRRSVGQAVLNHVKPLVPSPLQPIAVGPLLIDPTRHSVRWQGEILHLTQTEYCLLVTLAQRPGRLVSAAALMERCRGQKITESDARLLIKPHIANLRRKLNLGSEAPVLVNHRGLGFMLNVGQASEVYLGN